MYLQINIHVNVSIVKRVDLWSRAEDLVGKQNTYKSVTLTQLKCMKSELSTIAQSYCSTTDVYTQKEQGVYCHYMFMDIDTILIWEYV